MNHLVTNIMDRITIVWGKVRTVPVNHGSGLESGHTSQVESVGALLALPTGSKLVSVILIVRYRKKKIARSIAQTRFQGMC